MRFVRPSPEQTFLQTTTLWKQATLLSSEPRVPRARQLEWCVNAMDMSATTLVIRCFSCGAWLPSLQWRLRVVPLVLQCKLSDCESCRAFLLLSFAILRWSKRATTLSWVALRDWPPPPTQPRPRFLERSTTLCTSSPELPSSSVFCFSSSVWPWERTFSVVLRQQPLFKSQNNTPICE